MSDQNVELVNFNGKRLFLDPSKMIASWRLKPWYKGHGWWKIDEGYEFHSTLYQAGPSR